MPSAGLHTGAASRPREGSGRAQGPQRVAGVSATAHPAGGSWSQVGKEEGRCADCSAALKDAGSAGKAEQGRTLQAPGHCGGHLRPPGSEAPVPLGPRYGPADPKGVQAWKMPYNTPPPRRPPMPPPGGGSLAAEGAVTRHKERVRLVVTGPGSAAGGQHPSPGEGDSGRGSAPEEQGRCFLLQDQAGWAGRGPGAAPASPQLSPISRRPSLGLARVSLVRLLPPLTRDPQGCWPLPSGSDVCQTSNPRQDCPCSRAASPWAGVSRPPGTRLVTPPGAAGGLSVGTPTGNGPKAHGPLSALSAPSWRLFQGD